LFFDSRYTISKDAHDHLESFRCQRWGLMTRTGRYVADLTSYPFFNRHIVCCRLLPHCRFNKVRSSLRRSRTLPLGFSGEMTANDQSCDRICGKRFSKE
jgi:hypothetical protein